MDVVSKLNGFMVDSSIRFMVDSSIHFKVVPTKSIPLLTMIQLGNAALVIIRVMYRLATA